jgi:sugar phosphate isomerase/epimerase
VAALTLSSWAIHDWIGQNFEFKPGDAPPSCALDRLLLLPAKAREFGVQALEICDFHLVPNEAAMQCFRAVAAEAEMPLFQLLIDSGDISHPTDSEIHLAYVEAWIRLAPIGGFARVRVSAGRQKPTREAVELSISGLLRLKKVAEDLGVGISTENWHALMSTPEVVCEVLERTGLGFVFDFGNWNGEDKLGRLGQIAKYATSCHAKCDFTDGKPLLDDFEACLRLAKSSGFDGNLTLVHPEPPDEWAFLEPQKAVVRRAFDL